MEVWSCMTGLQLKGGALTEEGKETGYGSAVKLVLQ